MKKRWKILISIIPILIFFLFVFNLAYAGILNVQQKYQEKDNWCWAAVSQSILEYYGTHLTQTVIAQYGTEGINTWSWTCGSTANPTRRGIDLILDYFGAISSTCYIGYVYPEYGIQNEINSRRPLVINVQWYSGGGHFAVIRGINGNVLYLMDPWYGPLIKSYDSTVTSSTHYWYSTLKLNSSPGIFVASGGVPVYRFWSPVFGHHFFTASEDEKNQLICCDSNWDYEGIAWYVYSGQQSNTLPIYRFWSDTYTGHFYTANVDEKNNDPNWSYEGSCWYAYTTAQSGTLAVYRFWSDAFKGYFYTTSATERDQLICCDPNWIYEGIAYYALP